MYLKFQITQNIRDYVLLEKIQKFLNCGSLIETKSRSAIDFVVYSILDIETKIIPLMKTYPLQGNKNLDFLDFYKAFLLVKNKQHLTTEGLELLKTLKVGMNAGRK